MTKVLKKGGEARLLLLFPVGDRETAIRDTAGQKKTKICTEKDQKKAKKFLAFPGLKCYTIKRTFARGLFSNPQKENAFQKFTTENSPTRGARSKERRIHHEG